MKQYNCTNSDENPVPYWMVKAEADSKCEAKPKEQPELEKATEPETPAASPDKKEGFPPFIYQKNPFFPEFCSIKHK